MSVILNYKDCKIGKLDFVNNKYIYSSLEGEKVALKKYVGLIDYDLSNSVNKESLVVFDFFREHFLEDIKKREDILNKIGKNVKNDYEILEKFCKLNFDKFGFWLSNE